MTYAEEGSYPISVTIQDSDGNQTTATVSNAVRDAALSSGMSDPISATAGQPFSGTLASFSDANAAASASDFTASINWGDNSTSASTVTSAGNGLFMVSGSHSYAAAGSYPVRATVTDDGGSQTTVSATATVSGGSSGPTANNDSYTSLYDTTDSVDAAAGELANDSDPNHLPLSAVLGTNPAHGTVAFNSNGSFTYTPNAHWTGH